MDIFSSLAAGFGVALQPTNLLYCFVGTVVGTLVGVLPGLGPTAGMAILIPLTASLDPMGAIIMLAGIYYGSMYGGSTTAILINTPGEAASVITALDGYQMARQGRAGAALGMAAISSFVAGTISVVLLTLVAPPLSELALLFGPAEYVGLMVLGLSVVVGLSGRSLRRGFISALFGIALSTVGLDPISGSARFAYGNADLMAGIEFISVVVGLFAISEILVNAEGSMRSLVRDGKLAGLWPTKQEWSACTGSMGRSSIVGFLVGLLPGAGPAVASFIAYDIEKKVSKSPETFGKGAIEGVAAAEGANNSAVGGGLVPMMTLGIPTSAALAVLVGAFMIYGLRPGPTLFSQRPDFAWGLIASLYVGNLMLLVLNLPLVGVWARLALIPYRILAPLILVSALIGSYAVRNSVFDIWVAVVFGVVGYLMRKLDYPILPLVLSLILAPILEASLRQALAISGGSLGIFLDRPFAAALLVLAGVSMAVALYGRFRARNLSRRLAAANAGED